MHNNDQTLEAWEEVDTPQIMLRINMEGGGKALPYAYLVEISFKGVDWIKLEFSSCSVEIEGDRLGPLLSLLQGHTVKTINLASPIAAIRTTGNTSSGP